MRCPFYPTLPIFPHLPYTNPKLCNGFVSFFTNFVLYLSEVPNYRIVALGWTYYGALRIYIRFALSGGVCIENP